MGFPMWGDEVFVVSSPWQYWFKLTSAKDPRRSEIEAIEVYEYPNGGLVTGSDYM
ncbi:MAG: hypothetical protein GWP14_02240 [Actinobacteria bacterium]|nr:hypothetical protein [Actinomycetota bacterium]